MPDHEDILENGGFSSDQIHALLQVFAVHPHTHDIDEVIGLEDQLAELESEIEEDDDED